MILSERILLRPLSVTDTQDVFAYRSLPSVYKNHNFQPKVRKDVKNFIEKYAFKPPVKIGQWGQLAIVLKENNQLIGDCGFVLHSNKTAEIGYTISPGFQRKGLGGEAVKLLRTYLFDEIKMQEILANTLTTNTGSKRLLEKLGFEVIGIDNSGNTAEDETHYRLKIDTHRN